ncbi:MAG: hypothetical protein M3249_01865 [Thermoproteota archaeon]|nr:hypothetical protein [Thermoproteota archaeon]
MARGEFDKCPQCGIGTLKSIGGAAKMTDPDTGTATADSSEYKCDNCGYPQGGQAKVVAANEQAAIGESTNTTTTSSPAATAAAAQSAVEAVGAAVEDDKDKGKEGTI